MKYEIIYTEDCALIVSDEEIKPGNFDVPSDCSKSSDISRTSEEDLEIVNDKFNGHKKIIGHRPFTDAAILEGVPLLPKIDVETFLHKEAGEWHRKEYGFSANTPIIRAFSKGYDEAKETYIEILKSIESLCDNQNPTHEEIWRLCHSVTQPKRPKYFECDYKPIVPHKYTPEDHLEVEIETIINNQGQIQLVGSYI